MSSCLRRHQPFSNNLTDLFFESEAPSTETLHATSTDTERLLQKPGPFPIALLDLQLSSDSSYIPVPRRDLPWAPDSETSSYSSVSIRSYIQYKRAETIRSTAEELSDRSSGGRTGIEESSVGQSFPYSSHTTSITEGHNSFVEGLTSLSDYASYDTGTSAGSLLSTATFAPKPMIGTQGQQSQGLVENSLNVTTNQVASEVHGMLEFLRRRHRAALPDQQSGFLVNQEIPLPLSEETVGWLQQSSTDEDSTAHGEEEATRSMRGLHLTRQGHGQAQTLSEDMDELAEVAQRFSGNTTQQSPHSYYGEFYDDASRQYYEERRYAAGREAAMHEPAFSDGETVASSATYKSRLSVSFLEEYSEEPTEGHREVIPFREQDHPPDSQMAGCPAKR